MASMATENMGKGIITKTKYVALMAISLLWLAL